MWGNMSIIAKAVVVILFLLSAWSLGVMIDRVLMYSAARKQSRVFVQQVAGALREGKLDEAISIAERNKKSHIAKVVATGLSEFQSASSQVSDIGSDRSRQARSGPLHRHRARRNEARPFAAWRPSARRLRSSDCSARWSASSTRLRALKPTKATGLSAVAGGISEALVTTALGLLVAVPAVWAFNYFTNKVEAFDVEMDNSSMELINYFITRRAGGKK